jgi:hypothetical protein
MSDIDFEIDGLDAAREVLDREQRRFDETPSKVVGTGVEYAVYIEFGTAPHTITPNNAEVLRFEVDGEEVYTQRVEHPGTDPRPFLRPTVAEARRDPGQFIRENTRTTGDELDSAREVVETLALAVERRMKEIITEKGIIDTGTLRTSVSVAETESGLDGGD